LVVRNDGAGMANIRLYPGMLAATLTAPKVQRMTLDYRGTTCDVF